MADSYDLVYGKDPVTGKEIIVDYVVKDASNEALHQDVTRAYTDALGQGVCTWTEETEDPWEEINKAYEADCKAANLSYLTYFTIEDAFEEIALRMRDPEHCALIDSLNKKGELKNPTEAQVRRAIERAKAKAALQK